MARAKDAATTARNFEIAWSVALDYDRLDIVGHAAIGRPPLLVLLLLHSPAHGAQCFSPGVATRAKRPAGAHAREEEGRRRQEGRQGR
jgi:hypothetical protein